MVNREVPCIPPQEMTEFSDTFTNMNVMLAVDRASRSERVGLTECQVTSIVQDAATYGLMEMFADNEGGINYVVKLTDLKHMHTVKGSYPSVAEKMATVSARFDLDGNYEGVFIDMSDFDKGKYRLRPDGAFAELQDDRERKLNIAQKRFLGATISKFHMF